jgi:hypothetical protein
MALALAIHLVANPPTLASRLATINPVLLPATATHKMALALAKSTTSPSAHKILTNPLTTTDSLATINLAFPPATAYTTTLASSLATMNPAFFPATAYTTTTYQMALAKPTAAMTLPNETSSEAILKTHPHNLTNFRLLS